MLKDGLPQEDQEELWSTDDTKWRQYWLLFFPFYELLLDFEVYFLLIANIDWEIQQWKINNIHRLYHFSII